MLVIGTGGLGSPVALYLAAAGIGRIGLVDYDVVDYSNLQRQVIHGTATLGELKVESARRRMLDLNPDIHVDVYNVPFTSANAHQIAQPYDLIIDGTDNFPTRYLTNDLCVLTGKPNVYGSIYRFEGQVSVFDARRGPCYRCLFPEPPPPRDAQASGTTIVLVTQNTHEARRLAHRTMLLIEGAVVETAPTAAFFEAPGEPRTRAFLAGELVY